MRDITLIHLVSEQTMQNLIPILALKPSRIVQVMSADKRFQDIAHHLETAVVKLGMNKKVLDEVPSFHSESISEESPSINSTASVLRYITEVFPSCVLNITGGTKLMSIAAWQIAQERQIRTVYCDTQQKRIISTGFGDEDDLPEFKALTSSLPIDVVMAANGIEGQLYSKKLTLMLRSFGKTAHKLVSDHPDEMTSYQAALKNHFLAKTGKFPRSRKDLVRLANSPLPSYSSDVVNQFLSSAASAGLLRATNQSNTVFLPKCEADYNKMSHLQNLLMGGWFELYVADLMCMKSSRFPTLYWSVDADRSKTALGETDIVAFDTDFTALHLVSCKSTIRYIKPLEHIEALSRRSHGVGGTFARATVAVRYENDVNLIKRVKGWGTVLRVNVLFGDEVNEYFTR